jgi:hypothetical protein
MDKRTFETIDPILGDITEVAHELLESAATEELRSLLTELGKILDNRYLVSLHLNVTVFDTEMERCLRVTEAKDFTCIPEGVLPLPRVVRLSREVKAGRTFGHLGKFLWYRLKETPEGKHKTPIGNWR